MRCLKLLFSLSLLFSLGTLQATEECCDHDEGKVCDKILISLNDLYITEEGIYIETDDHELKMVKALFFDGENYYIPESFIERWGANCTNKRHGMKCFFCDGCFIEGCPNLCRCGA